MAERVKIKTSLDVLPLLGRWKKHRQENFIAITLDGSHSLIKVHHVLKGSSNSCIAYPRECFWPAIKDNAVAIIFAHNHPSGATEPSEEDLGLTERLCMAGAILGIQVLDHIIFTPCDDHRSCMSRSDRLSKYSSYSKRSLRKFVGEIAAERAGEEDM